jgi:glycosyltransferase involved in cell wall biosynthesis
VKTKSLSVSIVIPVYNEEDSLADCLDAIATQKTKPFEVVVVDNNCIDKSMEIARSYDFVTIVREKKQGMIAARNAGMKKASGDILARIDADTIITANWVNEVGQLFADETIAAASGPIYYKDMPGIELGAKIDHQIRLTLDKYAQDFRFLFGCNMAIRRSVWQSVLPELCTDEDLHEDIDIALHLFARGLKVVYDKRMLSGASARRLDSGPREFYDYIMRFERTYRAHGVKSLWSRTPVFIYLASYFPLKLLKAGYDADKRQMSLDKISKSLRKSLKMEP